MKRALSFIGSGSHKSHYRAMLVYHKKYLAVETGAHMEGFFFYKMKDGNINVTVNDRPLHDKMLAVISWMLVDDKSQSRDVRRGSLSYFKQHYPGAIKLP